MNDQQTIFTQGLKIVNDLADATVKYMHKKDGVNEVNKALVATLPKAERGSYYWWVRLTRENTGQALCDSGMHYGYRYNAPYKPEWQDPVTVNSDLYPHISLPHFLKSHFDAADEVAESLEKLLHWAGGWLRPTEHWGASIAEFCKDLKLMLAIYERWAIDADAHDEAQGERNEPVAFSTMYGEEVGKFFDRMRSYDLSRSQQHMTREEFVAEAMLDFPMDALARLYEFDGTNVEFREDETFYTYNNENDFDQDWMVDAWIEVAGTEYAIIRTHNGCDARGGYSSPVVAAVEDKDYVFSWTVDFYCNNCEEDWEGQYRYNEERELGIEHREWKDGKNTVSHDPPVLPPSPAEIREALDQIVPNHSGQIAIDGMPLPERGLHLDIEDAKAILVHRDKMVLDGEDQEEYEAPPFVIDTDDGPLFDSGTRTSYPASKVRLWCPRCKTYSVGLGDPTCF